VTASILYIDDEPTTGAILEHVLTRAGHRTVLVSSAEEAMQVVARVPTDLIIAEYRVAGFAGFDLLTRLMEEGYRIPVIVLTEYSNIEHPVMAVEPGAVDYLVKPIRPEILELAVGRALELVRLRRENETFRQELVKIRGLRALVGDSDAFRRTMDLVATVAASRAPVLLHGESGTGKALFARAIHDQSPRAGEPFVTVNCAALPEGLVESALFGQEEPGAFEQAHGGTLLLDDIAEMRAGVQAKLLTMIQKQRFERIGGQGSIQVDVRRIATSSRDLGAEVEAGRFSSDLYHRLNVLPIRVPTLRERVEDIPRLVRHFALRAAELQGDPPRAIAAETLELLQRYPWPGNVRELANAVERAVLLGRDRVLHPGDFDRPIRDAAAASGGRTADYDLDTIERLAIERALAATGGNRTRAARLLGISERTLRNKLNAPRAASGD
jgi:DNA-binding NtrC family response regulator